MNNWRLVAAAICFGAAAVVIAHPKDALEGLCVFFEVSGGLMWLMKYLEERRDA
jgi:hypothetical protein